MPLAIMNLMKTMTTAATASAVPVLSASAVKVLRTATKGLRVANDNSMKFVVATGTNLFALRQVFGGKDRVPNRLAAVDAPHIKRCLAAGLVRVDGAELVLTAEGVKNV